MKKYLTVILSAFFALSCAQRPNEPLSGTWVDLTHDFGDETVYWVTAEPFKRTTVFEGQNPAGFYYSAYDFSAAEHGGTHIDAPIHFAEGKMTVDQIEISRLIGPGIKIDVSEKAARDRDYQITVADLEAWESANRRIPEDCIILLQTGFASRWPDKKTYLGTDQKGPEAVKDLHFPGLHPDAATWLVKNRKFKAIGLDTASIDYGQSTKFESHVALMTNNIPAFENVADMNRLPATGFLVFAFPMKIKGGSGGPLRIAALLPEK